jgi:hypothetical protein
MLRHLWSTTPLAFLWTCLRSPTPGPPPFSSMNSTPHPSSACVSLSHRSASSPKSPSAEVARAASALNELGSFCKGVAESDRCLAYLLGFPWTRFGSLTPGPPPFLSMQRPRASTRRTDRSLAAVKRSRASTSGAGLGICTPPDSRQ